MADILGMPEKNNGGGTPSGRFVLEFDGATGATKFHVEGVFPEPLLTNTLMLAHHFYMQHQMAPMLLQAQQAAMKQRRGRITMPDGSLPPDSPLAP